MRNPFDPFNTEIVWLFRLLYRLKMVLQRVRTYIPLTTPKVYLFWYERKGHYEFVGAYRSYAAGWDAVLSDEQHPEGVLAFTSVKLH